MQVSYFTTIVNIGVMWSVARESKFQELRRALDTNDKNDKSGFYLNLSEKLTQ